MKLDADELCKRNPNLDKDLKKRRKIDFIVVCALFITAVIGVVMGEIVYVYIELPVLFVLTFPIGFLYFFTRYRMLLDFLQHYVKGDDE